MLLAPSKTMIRWTWNNFMKFGVIHEDFEDKICRASIQGSSYYPTTVVVTSRGNIGVCWGNNLIDDFDWKMYVGSWWNSRMVGARGGHTLKWGHRENSLAVWPEGFWPDSACKWRVWWEDWCLLLNKLRKNLDEIILFMWICRCIKKNLYLSNQQ